MNMVGGYRHDNSALTEQRVAQILSEARAAMNALETPQSKVWCNFSVMVPTCGISVISVPAGPPTRLAVYQINRHSQSPFLIVF